MKKKKQWRKWETSQKLSTNCIRNKQLLRAVWISSKSQRFLFCFFNRKHHQMRSLNAARHITNNESHNFISCCKLAIFCSFRWHFGTIALPQYIWIDSKYIQAHSTLAKVRNCIYYQPHKMVNQTKKKPPRSSISSASERRIGKKEKYKCRAIDSVHEINESYYTIRPVK